MTPLALARIQFAFTAAFHYLYPPMTIGLGVILVIMEGVYLKTGKSLYHDMARFWARVFGLVFSIGVATGLVMEFEFGTNWAAYSRYVGDVFGSALASEGLFAFFLESGFLAVLLFGWDRVPRWLHFLSTVLVAAGAHFSAVWIVVANSWMQTPAGYHIVGEGLKARAEITSFREMVFNPSALDRLSHVYMGAWQAGAWLVVSVSAYYLLKRRHLEFARASMRIGLAVALLASLGQLVTGHHSAMTVARTQPEKMAALEGVYPASAPADAYVLGWVNEKTEQVKGFSVPGMLSGLLYNDRRHPVTGLQAFARGDRPPVNATFQFYHLMAAVGMGLIGLAAWATLVAWRGDLAAHPWLLKLLVLSVLGPQIANQMGWWTAEVGRQPWIVYRLLRTSDALSKVVQAHQILASLIMFTLIYALLFVLFVFLLDRKIKHGPAGIAEPIDGQPISDKERASC